MNILSRRSLMHAGVAGASVGLLSGCKILEAGASVAMQAGGLSRDAADSVIRGTKAIAKTFEDFTPEQEYHIGRTVSANIFQKYDSLYDYEKLTYLKFPKAAKNS